MLIFPGLVGVIVDSSADNAGDSDRAMGDEERRAVIPQNEPGDCFCFLFFVYWKKAYQVDNGYV